jgi:transposase
MFGSEKRVPFRHYLKQGLTKVAVAEKVGVSLRALYHWIETGRLDRKLDEKPAGYRRRPAKPTKPGGFKPVIVLRLKRFPRLTAMRLDLGGEGCWVRGKLKSCWKLRKVR